LTLTNSGTSEVRTTQTNNLGYYSFQLLPPATYKLEVTSAGFQHFLASSIPLNVGQVVAQNVALKVGRETQTVTVTESGPQIESESSSLGTVLGNNSIVDLPINGRNSYGFAALVPGVRAPNLFTQVAYGNYNDQFLSINGSRVNVSMFFLDGGWNSNSGFNGPGIYPPIDLVQEYKVQTNNVPAEFGNTAGGVINVVTKSGTNQMHGSAYEFLRNDFFDANDFFANSAGEGKAPIRFNQFGGALGGPVYIPKVYDGRNKTFFFFAYEGLRWDRAYTTTGTMPTALQRVGDFSQTFNQAGQQIVVYDPNSTVLANGQYRRTPLPGNRMATSQINPVALNMVPYLPLPNATGNVLTGANNFTSTMSAPLDQDSYSLRVDQKITDNQKLFVRWSKNNGTVDRPDVYGNGNPNFAYSQPTDGTDLSHNQEAVANYNIVVNPTTVIELSSSVLHYWLGRQNPALGFDPTQLGMPSYIQQRRADLLLSQRLGQRHGRHRQHPGYGRRLYWKLPVHQSVV
jgi:Carboxypeptidase regulatory-like domain